MKRSTKFNIGAVIALLVYGTGLYFLTKAGSNTLIGVCLVLAGRDMLSNVRETLR